MTPPHPVDAVAAALQEARTAQRAVRAAPLSDALENADRAYEVQRQVADACGLFSEGPPRHWKSGGGSRDLPLTHAPLPARGVWRSPADASNWPFHLRGIEAEIAFRLVEDVDVDRAMTLDGDSAGRLVDAMTVSIEVVDSRWAEALQAPDLLRLADLQSHGALVLGDWVAAAPRDWSQQVCRVRIGAQDESVWHGSHPLGDPAWVLAGWLRHAVQWQGRVPAGTVVTTGSWIGVLHARADDRVDVTFDGIGSASLQF